MLNIRVKKTDSALLATAKKMRRELIKATDQHLLSIDEKAWIAQYLFSGIVLERAEASGRGKIELDIGNPYYQASN